jgi:hypothetical protein
MVERAVLGWPPPRKRVCRPPGSWQHSGLLGAVLQLGDVGGFDDALDDAAKVVLDLAAGGCPRLALGFLVVELQVEGSNPSGRIQLDPAHEAGCVQTPRPLRVGRRPGGHELMRRGEGTPPTERHIAPPARAVPGHGSDMPSCQRMHKFTVSIDSWLRRIRCALRRWQCTLPLGILGGLCRRRTSSSSTRPMTL